jgi:ParB family chromosome partitioning protein
MKDKIYKVVIVNMDDIKEPGISIRESINPDMIRELAESIKEKGLLNPIILQDGEPPYEIIAGHRRFLAFKFLGRNEIPAFFRSLYENDVFLLRAIENIQREDLSPIELANTYQLIIQKTGCSRKDLAKKLGKSVAHVDEYLRCLALPGWVQGAVHSRKISYKAALVLNEIEDENMRDYYFKHAIDNGITVKVAQDWLDGWKRMRDIERERQAVGTVISHDRKSVVLYACAVCNQAYGFNELQSVYICHSCYDDIFIKR